jgi:hypothetical protein
MNTKLIELALSFIMKKGMVYEAKNSDLEFDFMINNQPATIKCKIDHMTITLKE